MTTKNSINIKLINQPAQYLPPPNIPQAGGETIFLGRTRAESHPQFGNLIALNYEAYESMAITRLNQLAQIAATQNQTLYILIHHTLGQVPVGQASVLIQTLAPHRSQSFNACRFLIDELKNDVPIWKQEIWQHNDKTWVHPNKPNTELTE